MLKITPLKNAPKYIVGDVVVARDNTEADGHRIMAIVSYANFSPKGGWEYQLCNYGHTWLRSVREEEIASKV